jgi:glycosyltransferase involved in cell wall biosynthesis
LKLWQVQRPDVVHIVTEGPLGWSAVGAASELRLPITSSYHTNFQSYSGHYGIGLLRKPIEAYLRKLHNRTLVTMVPTHAVLQDLQSLGYQNLALLSRGVDTGLFQPQQRSSALRQRWGAGPDDLVCINVGRLAKEKNVETVVAAFEAIQSRLPKAKLVFVGDGPLRKRLEQSCPAAIFAGVQKDQALAEHYASGDLFLFPSLTETFGNVVPEALASGLAVVSYAKAAAQELITPGQDGVLVSVGTSADFVRAAAELAVQPLQMAQLRAQAPASVQQLSWQAIHRRFADILSSAISQHGESLAARAIRAPALSLPSA